MNKLNYPCNKTPNGLCIDCTNDGSLCDFDECKYMNQNQKLEVHELPKENNTELNKVELRAAAARLLYNDNRDSADYEMLIKYIDNSELVQRGHWIRGKNKSAFPAKPSAIWYCACCGEMIRYNDSTGTYQKKKKKVNEVNPRCRCCGAIMDGDSE